MLLKRQLSRNSNVGRIFARKSRSRVASVRLVKSMGCVRCCWPRGSAVKALIRNCWSRNDVARLFYRLLIYRGIRAYAQRALCGIFNHRPRMRDMRAREINPLSSAVIGGDVAYIILEVVWLLPHRKQGGSNVKSRIAKSTAPGRVCRACCLALMASRRYCIHAVSWALGSILQGVLSAGGVHDIMWHYTSWKLLNESTADNSQARPWHCTFWLALNEMWRYQSNSL